MNCSLHSISIFDESFDDLLPQGGIPYKRRVLLKMFINRLDKVILDVVFDVIWIDVLFSKCRGLEAAPDIIFIPTGYKEVDG